jgi:hypothetical protein
MTDRIELDLTSHNNARYAVLTTALDDYGGKLEHEGSNEEEPDVHNGREASSPQLVGPLRVRGDRAATRRRNRAATRQLIHPQASPRPPSLPARGLLAARIMDACNRSSRTAHAASRTPRQSHSRHATAAPSSKS